MLETQFVIEKEYYMRVQRSFEIDKDNEEKECVLETHNVTEKGYNMWTHPWLKINKKNNKMV